MTTSPPVKIRALLQADNKILVKILLNHPMEAGQHMAGQGKPMPAFYIQSIQVAHQEKIVLSAQWGPAISKNPFLEFRFQGGAKGDKITLTWIDNQGKQSSQEALVE